jgi:hypothetical protein
LSRYNITAELNEGHVLAAELALGALAPFTDDVDLAAPPEALLDWTALYAYQLADEWPGPIVRDAMSPFSTVYARPEPNPHAKVARELVGRYLKRTGVRV